MPSGWRMALLGLLVPAVVCSGGIGVAALRAQPFAQPSELELQAAKQRLERFRESLERVTERYPALEPKQFSDTIDDEEPEFREVSRWADKFRREVETWTEQAEAVIECVDRRRDLPGAERLAQSLAQSLRNAKLDREPRELEDRLKPIVTLPIGVIAESTEAKLALTPELLLKSPQMARERLQLWQAAQKTNLEYLKEKGKELRAFHQQLSQLQRSLDDLDDELTTAYRRVKDQSRALSDAERDVERLHRDVQKRTSAMADQIRLLERAIVVEERRGQRIREWVRETWGP
ncbi:coiled-coil domain-containing protein [Tuwongella immobilis]|uniref:Uncharacterized protein n=1 Tax=Tuwongella immobilis TaxID=692036 RepID=A0A6C2YLL1_9BACT|nr:hypothetical protein [Tuwongella immobilis]VIP01985.1 unnamed protein product [Tuwongella immobilis]VTS00042.1 unnamed protein product [Tuwongella immobilis]